MLESLLRPFTWLNCFPVFIFLLVAYFAIGFSLINYTPMTGDEIAHLSAGQGITQGYDINLEHPPLLKALDSIVLKANFGDFKSSDTYQWNRSITFLNSPKFDSSQVIYKARLVYLIFNCILILWLIVYTCFFKLLDPRFSLLLGILYVFSPSFYSHNYFITFDVAGAITALMSVLSLTILFFNYKKLNNVQIVLHSLVVILTLFLALNSKFSNFILLPVVFAYIAAALGYNLIQKDYKIVKNIVIAGLIIVVAAMSLTWDLYAASYTTDTVAKANGSRSDLISLPYQNSFTRPLIRMAQGFTASLNRSEQPFTNFVDNRGVVLTYPKFINRVFWFKENPILIVFLIVTALVIIWSFVKRFVNGEQEETGNWLNKNFSVIGLGILTFLFPLIYLATSWNSKLTIGYRHFYPVLIFIYFGLAWIIYRGVLVKSKLWQWLTILAIVIIYIGFGVVGVPQSLTYVNPLWTKEKWRLATDSTLTWSENEGWALRYMKDNNLLQKTVVNKKTTWNTKMDVRFGPPSPIFVKAAIGPSEDIYQTTNFLKTDLTVTKISDLDVEYLVVDVYAFQKLSNKLSSGKDPDNIFKPNFDYLQNHEPIYEKNDVVFIYKLK